MRWGATAAFLASIDVVVQSIFALGEEIGWRGFLAPRLERAELPAPHVLLGVIWGMWHAPLILWSDYATSAHPALSLSLFIALSILMSIVMGWLRRSSGSVWPAVILHGAHNSFYQAIWDPWLGGEWKPYVAGEAGIFSLAAYGAVVIVLARRAERQPVPFHRGP
jgi:membrane protease YdiL (CAAX protease family)